MPYLLTDLRFEQFSLRQQRQIEHAFFKHARVCIEGVDRVDSEYLGDGKEDVGRERSCQQRRRQFGQDDAQTTQCLSECDAVLGLLDLCDWQNRNA